VYFFWGTTYLGIRIALESFSPLILLTARFLLSGGIMLIGVKASGAKLPRGRELWMTALYGIIVLGGGNGSLVFAEQLVPSGVAALLIVTSPFWMVGLNRFVGNKDRIHWPTMGGIVVGFCGVVLLFAPSGTQASLDVNLLHGFAILQLGCFLWCLGALLQKKQPTKAHPVVSGAVQQFATGIAFAIPAFLAPHQPIHPTARSLWGLAWLVTFGSIVGYSAFIYAMEHLPVPVVTTYNYVNPIVAMFLGWLFYREPFGMREAAAMAVIFLGVAIVKWTTATPSRVPSPPAPRPQQTSA
jgi:drug/metabolite transporter (DMT)-like permease